MIRLDCPKDECTEAVVEQGTLKVRLVRDWEGDPGVINGMRSWWDMEIDEQTCVCDYDDDEWFKLVEQALEAVSERA